MKNFIIILIVIGAVAFGFYYLNNSLSNEQEISNNTNTTPVVPVATSTPRLPETVIGKSAGGYDIVAYNFGQGSKEILFVGGIHGGYEWNTVLVAREMMDWLKANPNVVPNNTSVTVIPVLNPDGLYKVVGTANSNFSAKDAPSELSATVAGRFNANNVDLNRNFDCDWQANGVWQNKKVNGGTAVFSEPESLAIKNYVEKNKPTAVVVWYSAAGGVYASSCHNGLSEETKAITKVYADASGYPAYDSFDFYAITGDMVNWLAKNNIPAVSVLLTNHTSTEWVKNQKGVEAILNYYSK